MSKQISRKERNSWYVPGKTNVEKQHLNEHETLQMLQRHALNNNHEEFYNLLDNIDGEDKRRDILQLRELKKHVDSVLEKKIEQSQSFTDDEWGDILFEKELKIRKISDSIVNHGVDVIGDERE